MLQQQMKEITNIFRRVYRIYAHAWFQHREMFWRVEGKSGLYVFFKTVCDEYGLIQPENYTIPPEAEGLEPEEPGQRETSEAPSLLKRDEGAGPTLLQRDQSEQQEPAGNTILAAGDTTKRHRHTRSDMSTQSVQTVVIPEEDEGEAESNAPARPSQLPSMQGLEQTETEKPDLVRQTTKLKEIAESLHQPGQTQPQEGEDEAPKEEEAAQDSSSLPMAAETETEAEPEIEAKVEEEEPPVPGVTRSDTVKPPRPAEEDVEEENQEKKEEEGDTTIVVSEVDPKDEEEKIEPMEPAEAPAGEEGDGEAGKSVGD